MNINSICSFENTRQELKQIFVSALNQTVDEIGKLFFIVDEESITFTFILNLKKLIIERTPFLETSIGNDLQKYFHALSSSYISRYVRENVVIDVLGHNRYFESKKSGSDFGLIYSIPERTGRTFTPCYHGLLIQAKRNGLKENKKIGFKKFGALSDSFRHYQKVKNFLQIALYNFEPNMHLTKILFLNPDKIRRISRLKYHINKMLKEGINDNTISSENFIDSFIKPKSSIVTTDLNVIKKYIWNGDLPCIELQIKFKDDGKGIEQYIRITTQQEQRLKAYVKNYRR